MAWLVDTSVFVTLERRHLDLEYIRQLLPGAPIALAAITASELLAGVHNADSERRREARSVFVERVLLQVTVLPFDLPAARSHARLLTGLRKAGQTIGAHDLQIAATALSRNLEVATHDMRDFGRVPGLQVRHLEL